MLSRMEKEVLGALQDEQWAPWPSALPVMEIAGALGMAETDTIEVALRALEELGLVERDSHGWWEATVDGLKLDLEKG